VPSRARAHARALSDLGVGDELSVDGIGDPPFEAPHRLSSGLAWLHQPVIAAVNGAAIGGDCASRWPATSGSLPRRRTSARPESTTASPPASSGCRTGPRAVGSSRAAEIMLTGCNVLGAEAAAIALVSEVVDEPVGQAVEMGERIAGFSQPGVELTKRALIAGLDASSLEAHMQAEGLDQLYLPILTDNFQEATRARKEKRRPSFRDSR
jgi:enoyl-CoA hydratase